MYMVSLLSILPFTAPACGSAQGGGEAPEAPKVYFVRDITPENMVRLYEALERPATGKVAVKLSTGEPGGHNFLKPELIKDLVQKVDDTIVECNTAYGGGRAKTEDHLKAAADHGSRPSLRWTSWTPRAKCACPSRAAGTSNTTS